MMEEEDLRKENTPDDAKRDDRIHSRDDVMAPTRSLLFLPSV